MLHGWAACLQQLGRFQRVWSSQLTIVADISYLLVEAAQMMIHSTKNFHLHYKVQWNLDDMSLGLMMIRFLQCITVVPANYP